MPQNETSRLTYWRIRITIIKRKTEEKKRTFVKKKKFIKK